MNKRLLIITLSLLSCTALYSQKNWEWESPESSRDKSYRIEIGPKLGAGLALATAPTNYSFTFQPKLAYQAGLSANIHLGRRHQQSIGGTGLMGFEVEAMIGGRMLGTSAGNMSMLCLEIPVMVQFYPIPSLALEIGPTFTKILKCSPEQLQFDDIILNTGRLTSSDIMLTAGICYKTPIHLAIDLRYNYGIYLLAGNIDSKVSTVMFSMAYLFNL